MIKLNAYSNSNNFVIKYITDKFNEIKKKIEILSSKEKKYLKYIFPEMFVGDELNSIFFADLLASNLFDFRKKYKSVNEYFEIVFFSSLDIKNICRDKNEEDSLCVRQEYFKNAWLSGSKLRKRILFDYQEQCVGIKDISKYICKNNKNFTAFQNYIFVNVIDMSRIRKDKLRYGILKKIFCYEKMVNAKDRVNIVKNLNIDVCPYCNRAYISCFEDNWKVKKERSSADIDHFYSKSKFVLFSLSLYNFVPCCKICNSIFKNDRNLDILYPYQDSYEKQVKFTLIDNKKILAAKDVYGWNKGKEIGVINIMPKERSRNEQIEREIQLFRIREVYQIHNEFAEKILYCKNVLGKSAKAEILECINKDLKTDKLKMEEFNKFFYGVDIEGIEQEIRKVPLAKLVHDILM